MAVFKGREVQVLGKTNGEDTAPLYTIVEGNGQRADVPMNQLQFTKAELNALETGAGWHLDGAKVIEEKELTELRDAQDRKKIEQKQSTVKPGPVEVNKVYVDPEVKKPVYQTSVKK